MSVALIALLAGAGVTAVFVDTKRVLTALEKTFGTLVDVFAGACTEGITFRAGAAVGALCVGTAAAFRAVMGVVFALVDVRAGEAVAVKAWVTGAIETSVLVETGGV